MPPQQEGPMYSKKCHAQDPPHGSLDLPGGRFGFGNCLGLRHGAVALRLAPLGSARIPRALRFRAW